MSAQIDNPQTVSYKRSFLIGCLLGDASSRRRDWKSTGRLKAEVSFVHALDQRDYLEWKANQFGLMFGFEPTVHIHEMDNNAKFWFTRGKRIRVIHDWFHKAGRKAITEKIRFMDHPIGLAMLLCDDGSIVKRKKVHVDGSIYYIRPTTMLATHCFTPDEVSLLLNHIEKLCGAKGYINYERRWRHGQRVEYARSVFNAAETEKLWNYVKAYIPPVPSMLIKFAYAIEHYGL